MYYYNQRQNVKNKKITIKSGKNKGKTKESPTSKNGFHYITRTAHHATLKEGESVEFVKSGNMPQWAKNDPKKFWHSADKYEIERGRTSQVMTVALPKELSQWQRQELVEKFIDEFANKHQFPFTCAVHYP
ncbi:MobA/MobL family protein [Acinetobacter schindleri]|uniref:MobA/MobL family protein n=1 Tax=Acinetobacter schindleri TaxID=108981 RepID=UPI001E4D9D45|nr:MobA/MobL family protein [Acinetobacter schindleri]